MTVLLPTVPKVYHIVHMDRLASIVAEGALLCDALLQEQPRPGTTIGMATIKQRRRNKLLSCHPGLKVGECVPFYFCPRSVILYLLHKANHPELTYHGGQDPSVYLEANLHEAVDWARQNRRRWAFTLSDAGSGYFEDRCDLAQLDEIDWSAIRARDWRGRMDGKQAEFLVERAFHWTLVRRVGVCTPQARDRATKGDYIESSQAAVGHAPRSASCYGAWRLRWRPTARPTEPQIIDRLGAGRNLPVEPGSGQALDPL